MTDMVILKLLFIVIFFIGKTNVNCEPYEENDDKLILKPSELINLVQQEKLKCRNVYTLNFNKNKIQKFARTTLKCSTEETASTDQEDIESLKSRKIWSRWGKWGRCSVTCGEGVIFRRRLCLTGRCAPGEFEEQRRPCTRAPCMLGGEPGDDFREQD